MATTTMNGRRERMTPTLLQRQRHALQSWRRLNAPVPGQSVRSIGDVLFSPQLPRACFDPAIGLALVTADGRCTDGKDWRNAWNVGLFLSASCPAAMSIST